MWNQFHRRLSIRGRFSITGWANAETILAHSGQTRKCLKVEIIGWIEYDLQKSRVTGPWYHKYSVSTKKEKMSCLCAFKRWIIMYCSIFGSDWRASSARITFDHYTYHDCQHSAQFHLSTFKNNRVTQNQVKHANLISARISHKKRNQSIKQKVCYKSYLGPTWCKVFLFQSVILQY